MGYRRSAKIDGCALRKQAFAAAFALMRTPRTKVRWRSTPLSPVKKEDTRDRCLSYDVICQLRNRGIRRSAKIDGLALCEQAPSAL